MHGCGEFGVEGLDSAEVMHAHFPKEWMSCQNAEGHWLPDAIPYNQTYKFHHLWYETPQGGLEPWIQKSHAYQRFALRHIGEAFRRDNLCVTCAIHLFIDAFPSNWMKTIMDFHRKPKGGYFGIKEAFAPLAVSIRTDRFSWYPGETLEAEAWVANDTSLQSNQHTLHYEITDAAGALLASGGQAASIQPCRADYQGSISVEIPANIDRRSTLGIVLTLVDEHGKAIHQSRQEITVFPRPKVSDFSIFPIAGSETQEADRIIEFLGCKPAPSADQAAVILCDDPAAFVEQRDALLDAVRRGARLVLLTLPIGRHSFGDTELEVIETGMAERHALSRATGHPAVQDLEENDIRFLHNEDLGYIAPFCRSCILPAEGLRPILVTGTGNSGFGGPDRWIPVVAAGEIQHGKGSIFICQLDLGNRVATNASAGVLAASLLQVNTPSPAMASPIP